MALSVDFKIDINKKGVKVDVKNIDINGFIIDKVFKKLNKKSKNKNLCSKTEENATNSDKLKPETEENYYTINI